MSATRRKPEASPAAVTYISPDAGLCKRASHLVARCRKLFTAEFVEGGIDLLAGVNNVAHAWAQAHALGIPDRCLVSVHCGAGKTQPRGCPCTHVQLAAVLACHDQAAQTSICACSAEDRTGQPLFSGHSAFYEGGSDAVSSIAGAIAAWKERHQPLQHNM